MDIVIKNVGDELGPEKMLLLQQPQVGLHAIVVVDNTACGPAIGGVRMAPDVGVEEVFRLARAMTFKNAAAGLPHGGGKAGIMADPSCSPAEKERLVRAFARLIRGLTDYIPGPDMGLNEASMAWIKDEIDRAVGLPRVLGGIPLDEIGATGFGLAVAAEVAAPVAGINLDGAECWMHEHGVLSIPDFIANAGGVICASVEYHGGGQAQAFVAIEEKIRANTTAVLEGVKRDGLLPREAANRLARSRVEEAQSYRRA